MSEAARRCLVAYDIADDRRRDRIATALSAYGERIQYSVFIVDARPAAQLRLRRALEQLADLEVDSLLYCDLGPVHAVDEHCFAVVGCRRQPLLGPGPLLA